MSTNPYSPHAPAGPNPLWTDLNGDDGGLLSRDLPAWTISVILHMAAIVALGTTFFDPPPPPSGLQLVVVQYEESTLEELPLQEFLFSDERHPDTGSIEVVGIDVEASSARLQSETVELPAEPVTDRSLEVAAVTLPSFVDTASAPDLSTMVRVRGNAAVGAVGTVGAVDVITREILVSLEQRPTVVVWLFDRSLSVQAQRQQVRQRFDRVYDELGLSKQLAERSSEKPLLTNIMSFGESVEFCLSQPTDDLQAIKQAINDIKTDPSGVEMTFTAVGMAAERHQTYRNRSPRRNVMLVVVTDEAGDDQEEADRVINMCRRLQMPVYVLGVPAPFGRDEIEVKFVDPNPNYDQTPQWLPMLQGPESAMVESVRLSFFGRMSADAEDLFRLDSGFGPYGLTRLAVESGGIYFALHPNRNRTGQFVRSYETPAMSTRLNFFFDPVVMHSYQPDYVPLNEYQRRVTSNKARLALVQAAQLSQVGAMENPRLVFTKGEGEAAEAQFSRQLSEAQRAAAVLEPRINALYDILRQGEKDRARLSELRWRAGYDLAYGRVMAAKARTEGYNAMLAQAKNGLNFKDPKNNTFVLEPANTITAGSQLDRLARQARELLEAVKTEHAGTPWALLAEEELKQPTGWRWNERFVQPPQPRPQTTPNNNQPRPQPRPIPPNADPPKPVRPNIRL